MKMTLEEIFRGAVIALRNADCQFALAGGFLASIYGGQARATEDVDFVLQAAGQEAVLAKNIVQELGLVSKEVRATDLKPVPRMNKKQQPVLFIIGRYKNQKNKLGLDFLLPSIAWATEAVERAQHNQIDFGFGPIPAITVEDFIISKTFAFANDHSRFNDLQDLKNVFLSNHALDVGYIADRFETYSIALPLQLTRELKSQIPRALTVASRRLRAKNSK